MINISVKLDKAQKFHQYYLKNKEKILVKNRLWVKNHKETGKRYYLKNKEKYLTSSQKYYQNHKHELQEYYKKINADVRLKVLTFYGGNSLACACCGETTYQFLSIDHIDGGGSAQRKKIGFSNFYKWLLKNNFPKGFQLLCYNCNFVKGRYGKCPHKTISCQMSWSIREDV